MKGIFNIMDHNSNNNIYTMTQNARIDIMGELEAIIGYETHLMQATMPSAQKTIKDIAKEEKLHIGQLFGLLFKLDPESKTQFEKGLKEFQETDEN